MIEIKNLTTYYEPFPQKKVLNEINLSIQKGDIISLLGANGSGKSTLLSILAGIIIPGLVIENTAQIQIDTKAISEYKRNELSRKTAYLSQQEHYSWSFSVFDAVLMGRYAHSSWIKPYSEQDIAYAEDQLKKLDLVHLRNRSLFEISGGEYQRVMIARALAQNTDILLLDEPFTHLDITSQHSLLSLIKKIAKENNSTVIMSLHDINAAPLFSNKSILLREGTVVCYDQTEQLFTGNYLSRAYDTEFGFFMHPYYKVVQSYIR